ncbi:MAG: tRNA preQ1(34) S-adenosylmethionine ribosyltransferase-isomerase QueA [Acidimicrobiales bacterium]
MAFLNQNNFSGTNDIPDYQLPVEAIAQQPIEPRDHARLLVDTGAEALLHHQVRDLPDFVSDGDLIVVNETKVLSARLRGKKSTGGAVEVFLLELEQPSDADDGASEQDWIAMVRPGSRVAPDTWLNIGSESGDITLRAEVGEHLADGLRRVRLVSSGSDVTAAIGKYGEVPLPPYLKTVLDDPDRYQTVYASVAGSVAAPTAGLHLTNEVLDRCRANGAQVSAIDLAVGLGTFRPVTVERLADHHMHSERYAVSPETMEACRSARRVIAIGTTTVRALESVAVTGKLAGRTDLLISGRYPWQVVDLLMTNFHQPRSTLLAMIEAFIGPRWREIYALALAEGYRFLSFGDAMLLTRAHLS